MLSNSKKPVRKIQIKPYRPVYPTPACIIVSVDQKGNPNMITLSEIFNVSIRNPVIIGIAIRKETYSYGLIVSQKEFTANFPTSELVRDVDGIGYVSGRNCDKLKRFSVTPMQASIVKPPIIGECPLNLECKVISDKEVGDHNLILAEVVAEHVDEDKISNNIPVGSALDFFSYLFGEYWGQGARLAKKGFTAGKNKLK